jgi:hypothetical protein
LPPSRRTGSFSLLVLKALCSAPVIARRFPVIVSVIRPVIGSVIGAAESPEQPVKQQYHPRRLAKKRDNRE